MDSAKALKFKAALGMSILLDRETGLPWSVDSAMASFSKFSSIRSAILQRILALLAGVVLDQLKLH